MPKGKRKLGPKSPEPKDIEISRLIRAQRLVCGMSQTELADAIGVTFQQVQKYEKGVNRVGFGRLYRIADRLKVPVTYFFESPTAPKKRAANINEGLEFVRTAGTLRLLRAFEKMDRRAQEHFLALIEIMTSGRKASRLPSIHWAEAEFNQCRRSLAALWPIHDGQQSAASSSCGKLSSCPKAEREGHERAP